MTALSQRIAFSLALAVLLVHGTVRAQQLKGDSASSRQRQAVEMCSRELSNRARADVSVERTIRNDYKKDTVKFEGDMRIRRKGADEIVRLRCTVAFSGSNRITEFQTKNQDSGDSDAIAKCRDAAKRAGYGTKDVLASTDTAWGRAIIFRSGGNDEVLCLSGNTPRIYFRRK
ncbi:MAG: hypothetical protein U1E45_06260 [Geminicoccaceae bacterium]